MYEKESKEVLEKALQSASDHLVRETSTLSRAEVQNAARTPGELANLVFGENAANDIIDILAASSRLEDDTGETRASGYRVRFAEGTKGDDTKASDESAEEFLQRLGICCETVSELGGLGDAGATLWWDPKSIWMVLSFR